MKSIIPRAYCIIIIIISCHVHPSEDFVNVFLAMAVLRWLPGQMQVYLTDLYPKGPFW